MDENDHPAQVPGLLPETPEKQSEWTAGERRGELRSRRRAEDNRTSRSKKGDSLPAMTVDLLFEFLVLNLDENNAFMISCRIALT
ncbi:hypothetical protein V6615_14170 [Oscillospiraceae bacterium PP1C4]